MTNEAIISVAGYIATDPVPAKSKTGTPMLKMRLAWTPRRLDRETNQWVDQPTCFAWVKCWRRLAENVNFSMNKGDPIVVSGILTVSEYLSKEGIRRTSVEITANAIGHDLSRGITAFRRQRNERTAEDAQAGQDGAEADSDRPEDAEGVPAADSAEAADIDLSDLPDADDGSDEEEEALEPASAG